MYQIYIMYIYMYLIAKTIAREKQVLKNYK